MRKDTAQTQTQTQAEKPVAALQGSRLWTWHRTGGSYCDGWGLRRTPMLLAPIFAENWLGFRVVRIVR